MDLTQINHTIPIFVMEATSKNDKLPYRQKDLKIERAFEGGHGGTLVIADTHTQVVKKACNGELFSIDSACSFLHSDVLFNLTPVFHVL